MKKKTFSASEKTDISRRKALARLGLAVTVAYAAPVVLNISHARASGGSGYYGGSHGGSHYYGGSQGGSHWWFGGSRGGSHYYGGSRGGSRWFGGSRGGSRWWIWW